MSYDIRFGVKVAGAENCYAVIGQPEFSSPSYNDRPIFVKSMDWDYTQGEWYPLKFVEEKVDRGIDELINNPQNYKYLEPENKFGGVESSLKALEGIKRWITDDCTSHWNTDIPKNYIYMRW